MKLSDEDLMAYADGELPALAAKRVEAAMADDPDLAARVARFRGVRRALQTAYDSVVSEPVPERFRALLDTMEAQESAQVLEFPAQASGLAPRFGPPAWAAMAASLVVGLLAGRAMLTPGEGVFTPDGLYASAALTRVLDTRLASAPENQTAITRIGLTFRTADGAICRTFAHNVGERALSGLACRDNDRWGVRVAVNEAASPGAYRQAGADAPALLQAVDAIIAGEPFDAAQEEASRDSAWASQ